MKNPTRTQLIHNLEMTNVSDGQYHDKETIYTVLSSVFNNYGFPDEEIKDGEDLLSQLWEVADSEAPIYTIDLLEWFKDNHTALDDYHSNTGGTYDGDIEQYIRFAYCWTLQQDAEQELRAQYDYTQTELNK